MTKKGYVKKDYWNKGTWAESFGHEFSQFDKNSRKKSKK